MICLPQTQVCASLFPLRPADPSTASSFNMPFTTPNYYNWLLGSEPWPVSSFDANNALEMTRVPMGVAVSLPQAPRSTASMSVSDGSSDYPASNHYYNVPNPRVSTSNSSVPTSIYSQDASTPEASAANQILAMSQMDGSNFAASLGYQESNLRQTPVQMIDSPKSMPTPATSRSSFDTGRTKRPRRLPLINEAARQGVLDFVMRARPKAPDDTEITIDHELLQLTRLQEYCDLYFKHFNATYPLLHQATFEPSQVDPLLLTSVLLLGATYSDKDSHLFAICIHDTMRAQIFGSAAFDTRPKLWILQTILLVEFFGKSRAGQLQHDFSHLFHGLLIKYVLGMFFIGTEDLLMFV